MFKSKFTTHIAIATLIGLITASGPLHAQKYEAMIVEGNRWDGTTYIGQGIGYPSSYFVCDKVVVGGIEYHKVISYDTDNDFSDLMFNPQNGFLVREDTIEKRVFAKYDSDTPELLFADFSLNVGDSIFLYNEYYIVDRYELEERFGEVRRVQYVQHEFETSTAEFEYIEGFGLYPGGIIQVTAAHNSRGLSNDPSGCGVSNITKVKARDELRLYPNPSSGNLFVESLAIEGLTEYRIYNMQGVEVDRGTYTEGEAIDVSLLPNGNYHFVSAQFSESFQKL